MTRMPSIPALLADLATPAKSGTGVGVVIAIVLAVVVLLVLATIVIIVLLARRRSPKAPDAPPRVDDHGTP